MPAASGAAAETAGSCASSAGTSVGARPGLRPVGPVHDADALYVDCDIVANPHEGGTGLKIKTVEALAEKLPEKYRIEINRLLVPFGKHICTGALPRCSTCPVLAMCRQVGVDRHR